MSRLNFDALVILTLGRMKEVLLVLGDPVDSAYGNDPNDTC